jgi:hypothetical protein
MPNEAVILNLGILSVATILLWPLVRALSERIRGVGRESSSGALKALRDELVGEVQQLRMHMGELAERVDFAERVLAREREAARLAQPGGR